MKTKIILVLLNYMRKGEAGDWMYLSLAIKMLKTNQIYTCTAHILLLYVCFMTFFFFKRKEYWKNIMLKLKLKVKLKQLNQLLTGYRKMKLFVPFVKSNYASLNLKFYIRFFFLVFTFNPV